MLFDLAVVSFLVVCLKVMNTIVVLVRLLSVASLLLSLLTMPLSLLILVKYGIAAVVVFRTRNMLIWHRCCCRCSYEDDAFTDYYY
jgi:hypothetical protein